ncbi:hypothetical protein HBI56_135070 [Parastagonospora nodorum]|uniref:Uncharacterized protein n=1 Tax=Phaeosphaeria nodorum (strain SN15 / ATCC MYA-4574 / FGSC 10173) TaxID=321614 RepID=A0A7U2I1I8_PHANO|nr:hypothetical protein HBH56_038170 [Parastagonospora nodorum]QRC99885.1 hypothetical protein JI435_414190 [Parastagonospora nodorum SN15]KAH3933499.1 hypothetical protein HBH54_061290 [Parastagonospora nodorum]KAH3952362.1 hypothetical protein HBH53_048820 [Parastagonospora nodorum]KAH3980179.1 hypothetical protein HBH52_095970 [Parastagonospora nodorum]
MQQRIDWDSPPPAPDLAPILPRPEPVAPPPIPVHTAIYPHIIVAPLTYSIPGQTEPHPIPGIASLEPAQQSWLHARSYHYATRKTRRLKEWHRMHGLARRRERMYRFEYVEDLLRYDCWEWFDGPKPALR